MVSNCLAPRQAKPRWLPTPQQLVGDSGVTHSPSVARPTEMTHWPEPRRLSANPPGVGVRRSILTKPGLDPQTWRVLEVCMTFPMPSSGHMPSHRYTSAMLRYADIMSHETLSMLVHARDVSVIHYHAPPGRQSSCPFHLPSYPPRIPSPLPTPLTPLTPYGNCWRSHSGAATSFRRLAGS